MLRTTLAIVLLTVSAAFAPAWADPASDEWQAVITGQVDAFHANDAGKAIGFAASGFKRSYADPDEFLAVIRSSGYGPIVDSRSHSFGPYQQVSPDVVLQVVNFIGPDQIVYRAVYQLVREEGGWRVGGVQLIKTSGVGA